MSAPPPELPPNFFRHEHGRLVAALVRRVGLRHLEAIEDAVQSAMLAALTAWAADGLPRNPSAWLHRVAHNELIGALRTAARRTRILGGAAPGGPVISLPVEPTYDAEVSDELLRMLFVCCAEELPPASRLVLALKTLCGFGTGEIAYRLFTTEANVYKRLGRARERLRALAPSTETPPLETLAERVPSVHAVLYLLFNEGYLSSHAEDAIRAELCDEAIRLGGLLAAHPVGQTPATYALLALMHLHRARLASRRDSSGGLLLLEEQDRTRWDPTHLEAGARWLARSASGDRLSRWHVEAGIAAEHAFAPSFEQTPWASIAALYAKLERLDPSPLHTLNRAVATAEASGPDAGLAVLDALAAPAWLEGHSLLEAVRADLHRRAGDPETAAAHRARALEAAPTEAVRTLLQRRLGGDGRPES